MFKFYVLFLPGTNLALLNQSRIDFRGWQRTENILLRRFKQRVPGAGQFGVCMNILHAWWWGSNELGSRWQVQDWQGQEVNVYYTPSRRRGPCYWWGIAQVVLPPYGSEDLDPIKSSTINLLDKTHLIPFSEWKSLREFNDLSHDNDIPLPSCSSKH